MYAGTYIPIILAMNGMFRISAARRCGSPHERAQLGNNALVCDLPLCGVPVANGGQGETSTPAPLSDVIHTVTIIDARKTQPSMTLPTAITLVCPSLR
jgi:hypothetical protein